MQSCLRHGVVSVVEPSQWQAGIFARPDFRAWAPSRQDRRGWKEEPQLILTGIPVRDFHQGGRIAFGPDGMLHVTVGDTYEQPTWPRTAVRSPARSSGSPRFIDPIVSWAPAEASPSGIAVLDDRIYIACLRAQRLYRVGLDGRNMEALLVGEYGRLRHVATAPTGRCGC